MATKACSVCGDVWTNVNPNMKYCPANACQQAKKEAQRECSRRCRENRESQAGYLREWRAKNPGRQKEYSKKWYESNKERVSAATKKRRLENPEKVKAQGRSSRLKNKEKFLVYQSEWKKQNPNYHADYARAYHEREVEMSKAINEKFKELI